MEKSSLQSSVYSCHLVPWGETGRTLIEEEACANLWLTAQFRLEPTGRRSGSLDTSLLVSEQLMETYDWEKHSHVPLDFRKGTLCLATFSFSSGSDQACVERTVLAASYSPFSLFPGECLGKERWPGEYKTWYRVHYSKQWHLINLKQKDKFQEKLIKCQRAYK